MLRKIILNLHIYGGLLCFSYLLILGISTLNFNHPFAFTKSPGAVTTWTRPMALPETAGGNSAGAAEAARSRGRNNEAILRALGFFAVPTPGADGTWTDPDTYRVQFSRPGTEYLVDVHPSRGSATVRRTRTGFWALVRDLHGSHADYPNSVLAGTWAWYTDLCVFTVIMAGVSGVYLWTCRRRERRIGLILLGAAAVLSLSLMLLVTVRG